ncbi:MAG: carbohydrate ABC transporter permease [Anaerolineae bacterium]
MSETSLASPVKPYAASPSAKCTHKRILERKEEVGFYLFISPWLVGFLVFTIGPMIASLVISFMQYDVLTPPRWIGIQNYRIMFTTDPLFWQALKVTFIYTFGAVPLGMVAALAVAILMNQPIRGIYAFRTVYYLPSLITGVPASLLWMWVFNPTVGVLNYLLSLAGIRGPLWLFDEKWVLPALMVMSLWGVGGSMIIYLASLQGVPQHLLEAAEIDGAGIWSRFWHVTVPMISPVIFFNLIMSIIGSFQVFTSAFVMTRGGPANASLFYVLYLYRNAFSYFKMGYASSLAWILFGIILFFSLLVVRSSPAWVYYEGSVKR